MKANWNLGGFFAGGNLNEKNLITGTRYMNVDRYTVEAKR